MIVWHVRCWDVGVQPTMARTRCILYLLCLLVCVNANEGFDNINDGSIFHNEFAVHIPAGSDIANEIASKYGYENTGQVII